MMTNKERIRVSAKSGVSPPTVKKWDIGLSISEVLAKAIETAAAELGLLDKREVKPEAL